MKTILFVLESLKGGGAERTVLNIVNRLDRTSWRPVLALYHKSGPYLSLLHDDVEMLELNCARPRQAVFAIAKTIKHLHPDLVFSTLLSNNIATVMGALWSGTKIPVVVRESNNQTAARRSRWSLHSILARWVYRRACRIVALSEGVSRDVIARYNLMDDQVVTIYNPIDIEYIERACNAGEGLSIDIGDIGQGDGVFDIIAVGKLEAQKGFDLLIRACAGLKNIPWRLTILGEGSKRQTLEKLVQELGVQDRVRLPGFYENPYAWMARADLFVLSSIWEGFGHVIAEAMVCGAPVLATRCPSGPDEIITDRVDGRLCKPDSWAELCRHIQELADHPEELQKYSVVAAQSVRRFDMRTIVAQYEQLFNTLMMHDDDRKS